MKNNDNIEVRLYTVICIFAIMAMIMIALFGCAPQIASTRYNPEGYTDSTEYCWYIHTPDGWVHHCEYHYHEPGFKIYEEGGGYTEVDTIVGNDTLYIWKKD